MAEALKARGYDYQYLWSEGARHVEGGVERQTMEEAMEWVWKRWDEIAAAEAKDPPSPSYGVTGKAESKQP